MEFQIPLSSLFTQVFGILGPLTRRYKIKLNKNNPADVTYTIDVEDEEKEQAEVMSNLGTPVEFPMAFNRGNYYKMNKGVIETVSMEWMYLPFTSVASFTRAKRRTKTYMNGQKGGVTEIYGFESWSIQIQGFIIKGNDKDNTSVEEQVRALQEWENLTDAISVHGKVFDWLGISKVEIVSITYPSARDLNMTQIKPYEMTLESVEPIELILP